MAKWPSVGQRPAERNLLGRKQPRKQRKYLHTGRAAALSKRPDPAIREVMARMELTLGHSPDPDDAFMFFALAQHRIPMGDYDFTHILQDIQTLNERAMRAELDITAVSFHASAYVLDNYAILRCGASMGDNYGPMLVAKRGYTKEELYSARIAIPGKMTSAFLALQM